MTGIYLITNLISQKKYVGKSEVDIINRLNEHKKGYKSNEHLQRAISKYGIDNFLFEVIEECPKETCSDRERYWISFYNCVYPNGYNYTTGGENSAGFKFSKESKAKMSESAIRRCSDSQWVEKASKMAKSRKWTQEERSKVSNTLKERFKDKTKVPMYGKHHSEETKKRMSESHKGSKHWNYGKTESEETKAKRSAAIKGRVWVNKNGNNKQIRKEELDKYLEEGYVLGMKKKVCVHIKPGELLETPKDLSATK